MELEAWCCYWYWRFLFIPLALQVRSAHFKHKYIPFFGVVAQEGKAHVLSINRWQSALAVEVFGVRDWPRTGGRVVGQTLYLGPELNLCSNLFQ